MIQLEQTFVSGAGGFNADPLTYRQIKRTSKHAIYERSRDGVIKDYETIIIRLEPKGNQIKFPNGTVTIAEDDTEHYPATGRFGFTAWSFGNLKAAEQCFDELENPKSKAVPEKAENIPYVEEEKEEKAPAKTITIPLGEFVTKDIATQNDVDYAAAALFIKMGIANGSMKFVRQERRQAKGKMSNVYIKT